MVKAISTIIIGDRTFLSGQAVTGLSPVDREWMKKAGYIVETADRRKSSNTEAAGTDQKDDDKNEFHGGISG